MVKLLRAFLSQVLVVPGLLIGIIVVPTQLAWADRIGHPLAVFSGLDKVTGRTIAFQAAMGETVQFGSLQITERACYTRPATEAPQTTSFVEVDEVEANKKYKRIFSGWMFAASPGLHGIEHPIYDIWLTGCAGDEAPSANSAEGNEITGPLAATPQENEPAPAAPVPPGKTKKHRKPKSQPVEDGAEPADAGTAHAADGVPMGEAIEVGPPPGLPQGNSKKPRLRPPEPANELDDSVIN